MIEDPVPMVMHWETLNLHELDKVLNTPQFSHLRKVQLFIPKYEFESGADEIVREQMAICKARGILTLASEVCDVGTRVRTL
jgi:hypothetical protein